MANISRRITGRNGQIWVQNGNTAITSQSAAGNSAVETVDGITYEAYQVFTMSSSANIPLSPDTLPTLVVGGSGAPAAYTWEINYVRGKIIYTPSLGASATVTVSGAIPKLYAVGDTSDWGLDVKGETVESHSQMQGWKERVLGFRDWSGSATAYYKGTRFFDASTASVASNEPQVVRFYPAKSIGTEYWLGAAFIQWGLKVPKGGMLEQSMSFEGVGPLVYVAS